MGRPPGGNRAVGSVVTLLVVAAAACGSGDDEGTPVASDSSGSVPVTSSDGSGAGSATPDVTTDTTAATTTAAPVTSLAGPATTAPTTTVAEPTSTTEVIPEESHEGVVAWRSVDVVDEDRPTDEVLGPDGEVLLAPAPDRTIPTELVYPGVDAGGEGAPPAATEPRPLIVWINGPGGRAAPSDPLLLALHEAGYVVAAPNGPEVSAPVSFFGGYVHFPGDVSAVIDALLDPDDGVADDLASIIDPGRIGVAGHSLGGAGGLAATYHDCCRDDRLAAAAAVAPPLPAYDGGEYSLEGAPLLIIHGSADTTIDLSQSEQLAADAEDGVLVVPSDADHFQPVYGNDRPEALETSAAVLTAFFDVHVAGTAHPAEFDALLGELAQQLE